MSIFFPTRSFFAQSRGLTWEATQFLTPPPKNAYTTFGRSKVAWQLLFWARKVVYTFFFFGGGGETCVATFPKSCVASGLVL